MEIQTFEAFSMKDAIKSVKKALGNDAVILSTKQKPAPGGKGQIYEVTASAATKSRSVQGAVQGIKIDNNHTRMESMLEGLSVRLTAMQDQMPIKRQVNALEGGISELKLLLLENLRSKDGSALKDLPPNMVPIHRQLQVMGVDEGAIAELFKFLLELPSTENQPSDKSEIKDHAIRWIMKRIRIAPRWNFTPGMQNVHVMIGTHGSGKSSLTAKLASYYHSREKKKIAVISYDVTRIAASEQMRILCKVIGVPFTSVGDINELSQSIQTFSSYDLVLVDTAGQSAKQIESATDLDQLRNLGSSPIFHLCLPVTEKETQLDMAVRSFSRLGLTSLAFTRLDEGLGFGEIFNLSRKWGIPLSFFSIGQNIPDDLERASRERVVERLFGL